jgi:uncharacterized OsmC-like protein
MAGEDIAAAWDRLERVLAKRPAAGLHDDQAALARWDGGLRTSVRGAPGCEVVTDMPSELGGDDAAPTPGWFMRAGAAACLATCIAVLAARAGIELTLLEAEATSRSDLRGMSPSLGDAVDPGPHQIEIAVRIAAPGVSDERLRALVETAQRLSPVSAALQVARPIALQISVGT